MMRCCISINDAFIIARLYSDDDFNDARVEGDHAQQHSHAKSTEHIHKSASAVMTNTPAANRRPFGHLMVAFFYDEKNALQNERESLRV
jgi:hypothetical protein